jgi:hypothetical protein
VEHIGSGLVVKEDPDLGDSPSLVSIQCDCVIPGITPGIPCGIQETER